MASLPRLYLATGRPEHLDEAMQVARSVLHRSGLVLPSGVFVEKLGTKGWDPGLFKGIMTRYLGQLRDVLDSRKIEPKLVQEIDDAIRVSVNSMIAHSVAPDGQYTIAWHEGAKEREANFNTQTSALAALIAALRAIPEDR